MFDTTCHFDLKTGSCQHTVCYYVAWQWVERERPILKLKVKRKKWVFASPSNLCPVRHSKRETSSLPDNDPQTTTWLVFPPDWSTWLKPPSGPPSSAQPTHRHGCTCSFQRQNANKLLPHLLLPTVFSRLNTQDKKELNSLCCPLSLLCLMFTLQAACNENYQPWTAF